MKKQPVTSHSPRKVNKNLINLESGESVSEP